MFFHNLFSSLPLIIFIATSSVALLLTLWGALVLLKSERDSPDMEQGRRVLLGGFASMAGVATIAVVFHLVTFFLDREASLHLQAAFGEFPPSAVQDTPPPLQLISLGKKYSEGNIGTYYFEGPYSLGDIKKLEGSFVYSVLCQNEKQYDILYVGHANNVVFSEHSQLKCWQDNCKTKDGLHVAYLAYPQVLPKGSELDPTREQVRDALRLQLKPTCSPYVLPEEPSS